MLKILFFTLQWTFSATLTKRRVAKKRIQRLFAIRFSLFAVVVAHCRYFPLPAIFYVKQTTTRALIVAFLLVNLTFYFNATNEIKNNLLSMLSLCHIFIQTTKKKRRRRKDTGHWKGDRWGGDEYKGDVLLSFVNISRDWLFGLN